MAIKFETHQDFFDFLGADDEGELRYDLASLVTGRESCVYGKNRKLLEGLFENVEQYSDVNGKGGAYGYTEGHEVFIFKVGDLHFALKADFDSWHDDNSLGDYDLVGVVAKEVTKTQWVEI